MEKFKGIDRDVVRTLRRFPSIARRLPAEKFPEVRLVNLKAQDEYPLPTRFDRSLEPSIEECVAYVENSVNKDGQKKEIFSRKKNTRK
jgi:hypothetical protein